MATRLHSVALLRRVAAAIALPGWRLQTTGAGAWHPVSAQMLRCGMRRLAGLQILSSNTESNVSTLSLRLVTRLARGEVA